MSVSIFATFLTLVMMTTLEFGLVTASLTSPPRSLRSFYDGETIPKPSPPPSTSKPPTSSLSRGCFSNKTIIAKKVYQSNIVFAAKILNLTEVVVKRVVVTKKPPLPESPAPLNYYHYEYYRRKRRRETSVVQNVTLGVGRVLVKTMFKGMNESLEGKIVSVTIEGGDGSKESRGMARCLRKLRAGDTRIFFYSGVNGGGWTLGNQTSVPLPPALSVLAAVRIAVKGACVCFSVSTLFCMHNFQPINACCCSIPPAPTNNAPLSLSLSVIHGLHKLISSWPG